MDAYNAEDESRLQLLREKYSLQDVTIGLSIAGAMTRQDWDHQPLFH